MPTTCKTFLENLGKLKTFRLHTGNVNAYTELKLRKFTNSAEELSACINLQLQSTPLTTVFEEDATLQLCDREHADNYERAEIKITLKVFLSEWKPEQIGKALNSMKDELKTDDVELLIIAFPEVAIIDGESEEEELTRWFNLIEPLYKYAANLVETNQVVSIGVSDFTERQLQKVIQHFDVKPSVNHVRLDGCCQVPTDLQALANENEVQLLVHNDPLPFPSDSIFSEFCTSCDNKRFHTTWFARYTVWVRKRSVMASKGYIVQLDTKSQWYSSQVPKYSLKSQNNDHFFNGLIFVAMFLKAVGLILLALAFQYVVDLILFFDVNKRVYNHYPGECKAVPGIENGSEDFAFIEDRGLVFISSGLVYLPKNDVLYDGHIFLYDFKQPGKVSRIPIEGLDKEAEANFHPHGLSHWILKDGTIRLFAVNHSKKFHHSIIIFDFDETRNRLRHVKTVKDDKFIRPNDVAAIGENEFVVSNDGSAQSILANAIELLTFSNLDSLVYHDGKAAKTVTPLVEIAALTASDNFYIEKDNVLWTGAHPVLKDGAQHLGDTQNKDYIAPSQVLRIQFSKDWKKWEITEVLADDGRLVTASSIAVRSGDELLVGTVQRKLIHCKISSPLSLYNA